VNEVEQIMNERLLNMRDHEIKEIDKDVLATVLRSYQNFLGITKEEEELAEIQEKYQIYFAARFLKTNYLEKRLKGVYDVRKLIERIEAKENIDIHYKRQ
jgi:hypothetical protein